MQQDISFSRIKKAQSDTIKKHVEAFLKRKGKIKKLPNFAEPSSPKTVYGRPIEQHKKAIKNASKKANIAKRQQSKEQRK